MDNLYRLAVLAFVGWVGYRLGWAVCLNKLQATEASHQKGLLELSLILGKFNESELAALDKELDCDASGRLRRMSLESVNRLREGKAAISDELSDWISARKRRSDRFNGAYRELTDRLSTSKR
jgi:hypothetical protein